MREGWLKNGPGHGEGRGREPFVPVSWERALDLVAGELARVKRDHGHDAIMAGSQGWGSAGIFHEPRGQLRRFMGMFGGFVDQVSNYSFGTALVFLPHVARQRAGLHRAAHVVVVDRAPRQADGAVRRRQSEEHAGDQRRHAARTPSASRLPSSRRAGVEVVNVSPIREDGPAAVAPEWIAIRPGTDTAMLLGADATR